MREALAAALKQGQLIIDTMDENNHRGSARLVVAAATKYLAQLPEKCGTCDGGRLLYCITDQVWVALMAEHMGCRFTACPTCHGSGKVYPAELVEQLTEAMFTVPFHGEMNQDFVRRQAVAALRVLNEGRP